MPARMVFIIFASLSVLWASEAIADPEPERDQVAIGGHAVKPGRYDRSPNESLASVLNRSGGIMVTREDLDRYRAGEKVRHIRIDLFNKGSKKTSFRIDPKSSELWKLMLAKGDAIVVARAGLLDGGNYSELLKLEAPKPAENAND